MSTIHKFRPLLSYQDIVMLIEAIDHVQKHEHNNAMAVVRGKLNIFALKVTSGIARASYSTNSSTVTLEASMGIKANAPVTTSHSKKAAYKKWYLNPKDCTADELELVLDYRVETGLLSEEDAIKQRQDAANAYLDSLGV